MGRLTVIRSGAVSALLLVARFSRCRRCWRLLWSVDAKCRRCCRSSRRRRSLCCGVRDFVLLVLDQLLAIALQTRDPTCSACLALSTKEEVARTTLDLKVRVVKLHHCSDIVEVDGAFTDDKQYRELERLLMETPKSSVAYFVVRSFCCLHSRTLAVSDPRRTSVCSSSQRDF